MFGNTSRPLYGGGSRVCVYFVYVYIVLWFVALLWVSLELIFLPLGRLWAPFGSPWAALGPLWGALGCHGGRLGRPRAIYSIFDKLDVQFRADGSQVRSLRIKAGLPAFSPGSPGSRQSRHSARNETWPAAPNPTSLAPGARMTVV